MSTRCIHADFLKHIVSNSIGMSGICIYVEKDMLLQTHALNPVKWFTALDKIKVLKLIKSLCSTL